MLKKTIILLVSAVFFFACSKPSETPANAQNTEGVSAVNQEQQAVPEIKTAPQAAPSLEAEPVSEPVQETLKPASEYNSQFVIGDSDVTIPEFGIEVVLNENAKTKLAELHEGIVVAAYHSVVIKEDSPKTYDPFIAPGSDPEIALANVTRELTLDQLKADFKGITYPKKIYDVLTPADRDVHLLINIYSARKSAPDNLLDCDILEENISKVAGKVHSLQCKLIGEN